MRNCFIAIALSLPVLAAAAPPQRVEIAYEVARNGVAIAEVAERLEHDGLSYRLQETWKGKGLYALRGEVQRSSRGAVAADGLRPVEFEDRRSGREPRRVAFDAQASGPTLERQDRLSLLWTFAFAPPASSASVKVADGKGVTARVYQPAGRERVRVPAGEFDALKIVKRKDGPGDRGAEIWLAANRHHLPVRILITEKDGTRIEQVAVRIVAQ